MDINRKEGENENQYIWRIGKMIDSGSIDNWKSITPTLNRELRGDETEYRDESAYRKKYQYAKMFYDDVFMQQKDDDYLNELKQQKEDIQKEKDKLRDERSVLNRHLRTEARVEEKLDYLEKVIKEQGKIDYEILKPAEREEIQVKSDNDLVVMFGDLHIGQNFASAWGIYDSSVAKDRVNQYINKILEIKNRHHSENCYVSLQGDMISNSIHKSLAITNSENVIEQIIMASEITASFLAKLANNFNKVIVASVVGNHSRIDRKEDALKDERLDSLIEWYAKNKLSNFSNVFFEEGIDNTVSGFWCRDKYYAVVHGDYDKFDGNGVSKLSMMIGFFPYCVLFGHRHYPSSTEVNGIKLVQSGSLPGSGDDHTVQLRLSGKPSQTVLVCSNKGIECNYTVEFD